MVPVATLDRRVVNQVTRLIVNADDFGYTRGVNRAIVDCYRSGIITSATLMANGEAFEDAVERAKSEPGLNVGCHLNLVEGLPVSPSAEIPHLVGADGKFPGLSALAWRVASGFVPTLELERECSAQIEKLLAAGIEPSHVDTHKHSHVMPRVASAAASAARRYSIGWIRRPFENARPAWTGESHLRRMTGRLLSLSASRFERRMAAQGIRMTEFFTGFGLTGEWTTQAMEATLAVLRPGITELMCHPGYCDEDLLRSPTRLKRQREGERDIMADPAWRARAGQLGIVLTGFRGAAPAMGQGAPSPLFAVAARAGGE